MFYNIIGRIFSNKLLTNRPVYDIILWLEVWQVPTRCQPSSLIQHSFLSPACISCITRCSAVGSAPVSGTGGLEFESPHFDQKKNRQPSAVACSFFDPGVRFESIRVKREGGRILCEGVSSSLVNDKQENLRTKRIPPNWTTIAVCRPPTCPVWWARKGIKKPHYVSTFKTLLTLCTLHSAFCIWRAMLAPT